MRLALVRSASYYGAGVAIAASLLFTVPSIGQTRDTSRSIVTGSVSKIPNDSLSKIASDSVSTIAIANDSISKNKKDSLTKSGIVGAPYIQYTPETGWAGGLVGFYYFHFGVDTLPADTGKHRALPSDVSGGAMYSQKHQFFVGILYDLYVNHDYHLSGGLHYEQFPLDFYGVGNYSPVTPIDYYTPAMQGTDFVFTKNLSRSMTGEGFNAGIEGEFRYDKILKSDSGGLIAMGREPGAHGGTSDGLGVILLDDTRDNIYSTQNGRYEDLEAEFYGRTLGSDYTFSRYTLDLRSFIALAKDQTWATQFYAQYVHGDQPFYEMQGLGGDSKAARLLFASVQWERCTSAPNRIPVPGLVALRGCRVCGRR